MMGLAEQIRGFMGYYEEEEEEISSSRAQAAQLREEKSASRLEAVLELPERVEDGKAVVEHLMSNQMVVANLSRATPEDARRLLDFFAGAAYARDGQIRRISSNSYVITPYQVEIVGDEINDIY